MNQEKIPLNLSVFFSGKYGWLKATIMIVSILLASGTAAYMGANVTVNLDVQARLDYLEVQQQLLNDTINIPVNSTISAMMKEANYIMSLHDSYYCLINGTDDRGGRLEYYSTNSTTIVNYALGNMTAGGVLFLKGNVAIDGIVTISYPNVAIITSDFRAMESGGTWYTTPYITTLTIDSSSRAVYNIFISGICTRQIKFNGVTNAISNVKVENTGLRPSGSANQKGIIFAGNALINYVEFVDCWMMDYYDQTTDALGAISFQQTAEVGSGQYFFTRFHYKGMDSTTMCAWAASARTDQVVVFDQLDHVINGHTGHKIFYGKDGSKLTELNVFNSQFEEHNTLTMFTFDAGHTGATQKKRITFTNNQASCGDNAAYVLTFITNNAVEADYYTQTQSWLVGTNNIFLAEATLGTFSLGTTGACTHFIFDVEYVYWDGTTETNPNGYQPYSYLISTDGTNYYLKNGTTNRVIEQSTDADTIINNGFGNATAGDTIFFSDGIYSVTAQLNDTDVSIVGQSVNGTVLKATASMQSILYLTPTQQLKTNIRDLTLDANTYATNCILYLGTVGEGKTGIYSNLFITGSLQYGIKFTSTVHYIELRDSRIFECIGGVYLDIADSILSGNSINYIGAFQNGTYVGDKPAYANYASIDVRKGANTIVGNYISGSANYCIRLSVQGTTITGNQIEHSRQALIYLSAATNTVISANILRDASQQGDGYTPAIQLTNTSCNNTIVGNSFYTGTTSRPKHAIFEETSSSDYNVYANNMIGPTYNSTAIVVVGLHSQIYGNIDYNPIGYITNPVSGATLVDSLGTGAIANNTQYTCVGSAKDLYLTAGAFNGATYNCTVNGQVIFSNLATGPTMMIHLDSCMTILFGWSSAPTIIVYGE